MSLHKKERFYLLKNLPINSKMIGFTILIIIMAGAIATFGLYQISSLTNKLNEVQDEDWFLASNYNQINSGVKSQLTDLYSYTGGNLSAKQDFLHQQSLIESSFSNITGIQGNSSLDFNLV